LNPILAHVERLREAEPYPAHVHPIHGDLRPQRLPAATYRSPPANLASFHSRCHEALGRLVKATAQECLFLYYPTGVEMHEHLDPDPGHAHWRVNVVLHPATVGGLLVMDGEQVPLQAGDAYLFRADLVPHAITPIEDGERIVWTSAFYESTK